MNRKGEIYENRSKDTCISQNDYESAIYRYEHTTARWKEYWWDCLTTIYNNCKEFTKKYVLDPLKREVVKIGQRVKATVKSVALSHTYFVRIFNEKNEWCFNKIGKGNDLIGRLNQQVGHTYQDGTTFGHYEIIKYYELPSEDLALALESLMRNYFRKSHKYIPNDRFEPFEFTDADKEMFENYYNVVMGMA